MGSATDLGVARSGQAELAVKATAAAADDFGHAPFDAAALRHAFEQQLTDLADPFALHDVQLI